jgi:hypothetical protein
MSRRSKRGTVPNERLASGLAHQSRNLDDENGMGVGRFLNSPRQNKIGLQQDALTDANESPNAAQRFERQSNRAADLLAPVSITMCNGYRRWQAQPFYERDE